MGLVLLETENMQIWLDFTTENSSTPAFAVLFLQMILLHYLTNFNWKSVTSGFKVSEKYINLSELDDYWSKC